MDSYLSACTSRIKDREPHGLCPEPACNWPRDAMDANSPPCTSADIWVRQSCNSSSTWIGGMWGEVGWGCWPRCPTPLGPPLTSWLRLVPPCSAQSRGVRPCWSCRRRSPPACSRCNITRLRPEKAPACTGVLPSRQRLQQNNKDRNRLEKGRNRDKR